MYSFIYAEPKRKKPDTDSLEGSSTGPNKAAKTLSTEDSSMNREKALEDIRKDWKIVKNLRKKDNKYQVFLHDAEFVKEIVGMNYSILQYLPWVHDNKEIVYNAVLAMNEIEDETPLHPSSIQYASERLKNDVQFIKELRDFMKGEANRVTLLKKFDSYIPDNVLIQIEPVSRHFLDKSIEDGDLELFKKQKDILPVQRDAFFKNIIKKTAFSTNNLANYEAIFTILFNDQYGKNSFKRAVRSSGYWSDLFAKWLITNISIELFYKIVDVMHLESNFDTIVIKEFVSRLLRLDYSEFWSDGNTPLTKIKGWKMLSKIQAHPSYWLIFRLNYIASKNTLYWQRGSFFDRIIKYITKFGSAVRLDFSNVEVEQDRRHEHSRADTCLAYMVAVMKRIQTPLVITKDVAKDLLKKVIKIGYMKSVKILADAYDFKNDLITPSLFFGAIKSGNLELVKFLEKYGNDLRIIDQGTGNTTLIAASNSVYVASYIINKRVVDINARNQRGYTALSKACSHKNLEVVQLLLKNQADPNIANLSGRTPIFKAISKGSKSIVRVLLNPIYGANINISDIHGNTPLHTFASHLAWNDDLRSIFLMLMARGGASILNKKSNNQKTPLMLASGISSIFSLFVSAGAGGTFKRDYFANRINFHGIESPVTLQLLEDNLQDMTDYTTAPVRCIPCKHVFPAQFLQTWLLTRHTTTPYKTTCPQCRVTINNVEIMSSEAAKNWDENEGKAIKIDEEAKKKLQNIKYKPTYKQLVIDFEKLKKEKEEEEERVRNLRKTITDASEKAQKEFRDLRLLNKLRNLGL